MVPIYGLKMLLINLAILWVTKTDVNYTWVLSSYQK